MTGAGASLRDGEKAATIAGSVLCAAIGVVVGPEVQSAGGDRVHVRDDPQLTGRLHGRQSIPAHLPRHRARRRAVGPNICRLFQSAVRGSGSGSADAAPQGLGRKAPLLRMPNGGQARAVRCACGRINWAAAVLNSSGSSILTQCEPPSMMSRSAFAISCAIRSPRARNASSSS